MPKYLIERALPGAGDLTTDQLGAIARKSCDALRELGPEVQWEHSYVTADKIFCVYVAPNESAIHAHGRLGGFPVTTISTIEETVDPTHAIP